MADLALLGGKPTVTEDAPTWPRLTDADIEAATAALLASRQEIGNLTSVIAGGVVKDFETDLRSAFSSAYALTVNSGGAALHAALMAAGVGVGDEVIVSPYTWGQSVSCVLQQCAVPVFADIDETTYTLDPRAVETAVTGHTKAIVVPHIYGQPSDMSALMVTAERHGLVVIEDCAQAAGAAVDGRRVGTIGHIGCFSIGSGKQIVGGEGGFLLTQDHELYERLLLATQHPVRSGAEIKTPELAELVDSFIFTYRIHPTAAALCRRQLQDLDEWNACRADQLQEFSGAIAGCAGVRPVVEVPGRTHVYHSYSPTYRAEELHALPRAVYVAALRAEGVPIAESYVGTPLHLTPRFQERRGYVGGGLPWSAARRPVTYERGDCAVAETRCEQTDLSVYLGPNLATPAPTYLRQVADAFAKVAEQHEALLGYEPTPG
jgi:dTDP-4-amino-4,6-dideoxygalactose transaminase